MNTRDRIRTIILIAKINLQKEYANSIGLSYKLKDKQSQTFKNVLRHDNKLSNFNKGGK